MEENKLPSSNKSGFRVPIDYFGNLEETLMRKISQDTPVMDRYKGKSGFEVPQDYFATLEEKILSKVDQPVEGGKVISLFKNRRFYYAAAVAAIVVVIISMEFYKTPTPTFSVDSVELSALEEYIDEGYIDLNFNEISSYITEEGNPIENFNASALSDEEMLNYLSENVEDPGLLIE